MEKEEIMKRPMFLQVMSFLILARSVTFCTQIQIRMYIVMISSRKRDNNISECEGFSLIGICRLFQKSYYLS